MAEQNPTGYRADMVGACEKILRYCETRTVTVLGEATGRLDRPWTSRYPDVPWAAITGIHHRAVHDDGHVDPAIVWDTVQEDVPVILSKLRKTLSSNMG